MYVTCLYSNYCVIEKLLCGIDAFVMVNINFISASPQFLILIFLSFVIQCLHRLESPFIWFSNLYT